MSKRSKRDPVTFVGASRPQKSPGPFSSPRTWILLRGLCRESRHWGDFLPTFKAALPPQDQVHAVDLPGVGERWTEASPSSMEKIVEAVRHQAEVRDLPKPYSFFAVSLGAMVALKWAEMYPDEVREFFVINTSDAHSAPPKRLRIDSWGHVLSAALTRDSLKREQAILKAISNSPERAAQVAPDWALWGQEKPLKVQVAVAQLMAARSFKVTQTLKAPGYFLISLGDRFVDPSCSFFIAKFLNCPILTHPWGGHDLTLDDPQWVTSRVVELVAK